MNFIDIQTSRALADLDDPRCGLALKRHIAADLIAALIDALDDTEADCDLEPSLLSPDDLEGDGIDDGGWQGEGSDNFDDEPSLAAPEPVYEPVDYWAAKRSIVMPATPLGSQAGWCTGTLSDLEDEHDGAEPENEHGPSWSEHSTETGPHLSAFGGEDDETSLGTPEQVNQVERLVLTGGWLIDDGEEDVQDQPHDWDELEDSLGCLAIQTPHGLVCDREGSECGLNVCDDHGIADSGALADADLSFRPLGNHGGRALAEKQLAAMGFPVSA